jgi:sugar lactone lactonase YvrE
MDGVAVDANDQLYVATSLPGKIVRVRGDGTGAPVIVAQGLTTPASMAFGRAPDFDPCSLYVTSIRDNRIWRVAVGAQGASLP